jgi:hypothetical protein
MNAGYRMLISIRRYVPPERRAEYAAGWAALHAAATGHGAHAWHFVSVNEPDVYIEFLEFGSDNDVRAEPGVVAAIQSLHERFGDAYPMPRTLEEWVEIPAAAREGA